MSSEEDLMLLHGQLNVRNRDSVQAVGKRAAASLADTAKRGMLNSSRVSFLLIEDLEEEWRSLLDRAFQDARDFRAATGADKSDVVSILRQKLEGIFPHLVAKARLDNPNPIWADVSARIHDLLPRLELKLRQYQLGIGEPKETPNVTYSIRAGTINGPIQQGTHQSTQNVTMISSNDLFVELERAIGDGLDDEQLKAELRAIVREMETTKETSGYVGSYQRFMASAANHMTVFAPFLPALAQLLPQAL